MNFRQLLAALQVLERDAPSLLDQNVTIVANTLDDIRVEELVLVNAYGDERVFFVVDFIPPGGEDDDEMDAS